jgi:hypothetical protein
LRADGERSRTRIHPHWAAIALDAAQLAVVNYGRSVFTMENHKIIVACEEQLVKAQLSGDVAELDRLLDDGLIYTGLDGRTGTKGDDLSLHRSGRFRITRMDLQERQIISVSGNVSVVLVRMDSAATIDGIAIHKSLRYTRVWAKRDGVWRLVAAHLSEAPDNSGTVASGA